MLQLEKHWFRGPAQVILWLHPPQVQAAREDQGEPLYLQAML